MHFSFLFERRPLLVPGMDALDACSCSDFPSCSQGHLFLFYSAAKNGTRYRCTVQRFLWELKGSFIFDRSMYLFRDSFTSFFSGKGICLSSRFGSPLFLYFFFCPSRLFSPWERQRRGREGSPSLRRCFRFGFSIISERGRPPLIVYYTPTFCHIEKTRDFTNFNQFFKSQF